ncbi:MAG TPA: hypothetical protein VFZ37_13645 [Jiangellaceae bacterium]
MGEVLIHRFKVINGYYGNPVATEQAARYGRPHPGDLGHVGADEQHLARYQRPPHVHLVPAPPKIPSAKPTETALREKIDHA